MVIGLSRNDKSHLEKFANNIDYGGDIFDNDPYHKQRDAFDHRSTISIHRLKICDDLINHGITQNKSKECSLPKTISDELMHHFIRGLVDADGCWYVNAKNNMRFLLTCSVYEFLVELRAYFANKLRLNPNIKINAKIGCWYLEYAGNKQCRKIYEYLYNDATVYLDRKYERCKNHFDKIRK